MNDITTPDALIRFLIARGQDPDESHRVVMAWVNSWCDVDDDPPERMPGDIVSVLRQFSLRP